MKLEEYSTEELRNELKRRNDLKKANDSIKPRCRNCVYYTEDIRFRNFATCGIRTFMRKGKEVHYSIRRSGTCDKFKLKENK